MQKTVLLLMFMVNASCLFGMEKLIYSTSINGTKITVSQDDLHKRTQRKGMQNITVIGKQEQMFLYGDINDFYFVGNIYCHDQSMLVKSPIFKNFLNDCYKNEVVSVYRKFGGFKDSELFALEPDPVSKVNVDSIVIQVIEPKIGRAIDKYTDIFGQEIQKESCIYFRIINSSGDGFRCRIFEERAHQKAKKDLSKSYKNVLKKAHTFFTSEHQEKSIAFPFLSSLLGMRKEDAAEVAVQSVAHFLNQDINKDKYGLIEFVLEEQEDVALYEKYLSELNNK